MKKNNKILEEKISSVGIDLSIAASVIKFLEASITDNTNYSNSDLLNLTAVLARMLNSIIIDYSKIEELVDV